MTGIWRRASLPKKFLFIIVPLLLTTTFAAFILFNALTERGAASELRDRMEKLATIQSSSVAEPLWSFDYPQLKLVLKAMLNDPDIRGISVLDETGNLVDAVGELSSPSEDLLIINQPLIHVDLTGAESQRIGTLRMSYSEARLRHESRERLQFTLLLAGLMTLFVVVGAVTALYTAVSRPLATFLDRIELARKRDDVAPFIWNHADEIGALATAYNELQHSQRVYRNEIIKMRDELETRVQERTKDLKDRESQLIRARDEAEETLENLRNAQSRLVESERLASLGQLTAGIAHEIKNPLNIVNNFAHLSRDLLAELAAEIDAEAEKSGRPKSDTVAELVEMVSGNLAKIDEHGRRADSIVTNMLAHSRSDSGAPTEVDPNRLVSEAVALVYHGLRAQHRDFNITIERSFQPDLPHCTWYAQGVQRSVMNIVLNGIQAAMMNTSADGTNETPIMRVSTELASPGIVRITIEDNGPGIPDAVGAKIFDPFFTTKKPGEGTGLGLSMAYETIVVVHGGELSYEARPRGGTRFTILLPVSVATAETRKHDKAKHATSAGRLHRAKKKKDRM